MTGTDTVACPSCGEPCSAGSAFCVACGTELAPAAASGGTAQFVPVCPACSAEPDADPSAEVTADGCCATCGRKVPTGRDHIELDLGPIAGVTDRGLRHPRNEDAMALATADTAAGPVAIAVVCDGVSSSARPDEASLAAVQAAVRVLLESARAGGEPGEASLEAVRSAATALAGLAAPGEAPSSTYVSAVIAPGGGTGDGPVITLSWAGDSRAYWLADEGSRRLTTDDSVAQEMVASGLLGEAEAMASAHAHVITRWLGADAADPQPHLLRFEPTGPGVLLVCTDGLWNYLPAAGELAGRALPDATDDPLGAAGALLKVAMDAGGADNITVVLAPVPLDQGRTDRGGIHPLRSANRHRPVPVHRPRPSLHLSRPSPDHLPVPLHRSRPSLHRSRPFFVPVRPICVVGGGAKTMIMVGSGAKLGRDSSPLSRPLPRGQEGPASREVRNAGRRGFPGRVGAPAGSCPAGRAAGDAPRHR